MDQLATSLVDWSRAQFALTAIYHWLFVPLTLGLGIIICIMETIYYRTKNEEWGHITKFWMTLFGVNFAMGVATGIILEFQFGTNWSNYSWFVGDIFGAPLAIEGIVAFFLEATFLAVMFFGWNKVSRGFHLASTWITMVGATLSALWILIANAWMQYPVGMVFNPETVRNEMNDFWAIALSPVAVNKFFHTVTSSWIIGSVFVIGISCWYLLRNRNVQFSLRSIKIAAIFGLFAILLVLFTGHGSAQQVADKQPMKLAAMEGLYHGGTHQGLVAFGILNPKKKYDNNEEAFLFAIKFPSMLSWLVNGKTETYVPGVADIFKGGYNEINYKGERVIALPIHEKIERGKTALAALAKFQQAKAVNDTVLMSNSAKVIEDNYAYFGYGYVQHPSQLVPNVGITFYAFHIMVVTGFSYLLLFALVLLFVYYKRFDIVTMRWFQWICLLYIPITYISSEAGWVVAEVGRQPWAIQEILPTWAAYSNVGASNVIITFFIFLTIFTVLLITDITIMVKQIKKGPEVNNQ